MSTFSALSLNALDKFPDLRSVPPHRYFNQHDMVDMLRKAVPFDYILVAGLDLEKYRLGNGISIDTNLPPAFLETYFGDGLDKSDPFLIAAKQAEQVVLEHEVHVRHPPSERLRYVLDTFGIFNRTLIPVRRSNVVYGAICVTRERPFDSIEISFLGMIAESLHRQFTTPLMERFGASELNLSAGEIACLRAASSGQTSEEVAKTVGFQPDTVNTYIKTSIKKLGAANRVEAIAEAIRRRLIA